MDKKKKRKILTIAVMIMCTGCSTKKDSSVPVTDYGSATEERLNVQIAGDFEVLSRNLEMNGYTMMNDPDPAFYQITVTDSLDLVQSRKATAVLVYSDTDCPYCQRAIPILNEVAKETGTNVFYVDMLDERFTSKSEDEQNQIMSDFTSAYTSVLPINEDGTQNFSIPFVVGIKDGEVTQGHVSLVDSFEYIDDSSQMNDEQVSELKNIYTEIINSTK